MILVAGAGGGLHLLMAHAEVVVCYEQALELLEEVSICLIWVVLDVLVDW